MVRNYMIGVAESNLKKRGQPLFLKRDCLLFFGKTGDKIKKPASP